ncbi:MAG: CPBP family intramembrane glutamic endopeptidase [bacterium]
MNTFNVLINGILQLMLFSFIPFIWWLVKERKKYKFLEFIGLKRPILKDSQYLIISILATIIIALLTFITIPNLIIDYKETAIGQFAGSGISALLPALIFAFINTGLSEEILFRGFIAKQLIRRYGFYKGNFLQGLVFGLLHGVLFFSLVGFLYTAIIIIITSILGWILGYINEKVYNGSILPSWLIHAIANYIGALIAMFNLI